jgi:hypothetical protein
MASLSRNSTIGDWLDSPIGGPIIGELLKASGQNAEVMAPVRPLPLKNLVAMSGGAMTDEMIDGLVQQARAQSGETGE